MRLLKRLLPFLLLCSSAFAALPAAMVWEVQTGGSQKQTAGDLLAAQAEECVDYSQNAAAHFNSTAFKMTKPTGLRSGTRPARPFDAADVNNVPTYHGWYGWTAGWYHVTASM